MLNGLFAVSKATILLRVSDRKELALSDVQCCDDCTTMITRFRCKEIVLQRQLLPKGMDGDYTFEVSTTVRLLLLRVFAVNSAAATGIAESAGISHF